VLGLYPQDYLSSRWRSIAVDNLFNYIPGEPTQSNQFSSKDFAYFTSKDEAFRFFYGDRPDEPGSPVAYQKP
jgi:hypothetical protein